MALLPDAQGTANKGAALFWLENKGSVDAFLSSSEEALIGASVVVSEPLEVGPYDWPGASVWLHLPAGAEVTVTPFRTRVGP